ncbi:hypothetical protein RSOLAG22IIIB_08360 [Rhizoctonia solani]|uniref:Uncharacterized protein n=1 Tax=Rhizoctonia solani TaxID=456999 RepID=A0A0K6FSL4_9AGAM|nr:hypothetical protein RSOLAG22IIIB_08360 [Rhizoctonia solani]
MKAHYSNLPNTPSDSRNDLPFKDQISSNPDCEDQCVIRAPKTLIGAWIGSLWALVLHHVLSIGVTILVLTYVDGHHFNVAQRSPPVHTARGTYKAPFNPLQSDVTTALSSAIVVLKCALMAWVTPLIWRVAIFLMERRGLARRDLKVLLRYGVLTPGVYRKDFSTLVIGPLLITCMVANFSSPILTGSISWVPSNQLAHNLPMPIRTLGFNHIEAGIYKALPTRYRNSSSVRGGYVTEGAGRVAIGWGRNKDTGVLKRVSPAVDSLAINSTVENVTLPYFQVHSIRWIKTIDDIIPHIRAGALNYSNSGPTTIDRTPYGSVLLFPSLKIKQKWSNDSLGSTIVRDTRLLALHYGSGEAEDFTSITQDLPLGTYTLSSTNGDSHYAFAWVTFSAGAGHEARRSNATLRSTNLDDPLAPVVKANGEESALAPQTLRQLFSYDSAQARALVRDYALREHDVRERNLNRFMAHIGVQFNLIPIPVMVDGVVDENGAPIGVTLI